MKKKINTLAKVLNSLVKTAQVNNVLYNTKFLLGNEAKRS